MIIVNETKKVLSDPIQRRRNKALALFESGHVAVMDRIGTRFKVKSQAEDGGWYTVVLDTKTKLGHCTCHDFVYNNVQCKHITASKYMRHELGYAV